MMRQKKNLAVASQPALSLAALEHEERDAILDHLVRVIGSFGFKQILVSPLEEREAFFKNPKFARHFREKVLDVNHPQKDLVLAPTNLYGALKRFAANVKIRGPHVVKWFYVAPLVENQDQKTALRHELGIFIFGDGSSLANAQLINTVSNVFSGFGLPGPDIEINSLGCANCQKQYQDILRDTFGKSDLQLCAECTAKLADNPLAVWTCEKQTCQTLLASAPQIVDFLDNACRETLIGLLETLDSLGIVYNMNPTLVGSRVSEHIVFQTHVPDSSPRVLLGEGGDYTSWSVNLAEEALPMVGFVTDLETIWNHLAEEKRSAPAPAEVFLIALGQIASRRIMNLQKDLHTGGVTTAESMLGSLGIKNQLKEAADHKAEISLIIGQKEALDDTVILRDMVSGMQEVFAYDRTVEEVKKRLGE